MNHGGAAVTPTQIVQDQQVPGGQKSSLTITTASLDDLRASLAKVFDGVYANAELIVNPTPATMPSVGCTAGVGHACLLGGEQSNPNGLVTLFNPDLHSTPDYPLVDPALVSIDPLNPLDQTVLPLYGVDLTRFQGAAIDPEGFTARLAEVLPSENDVRVKVKVRPAGAYIGNRAGSNGLWIPVDLVVEEPATRHHECGNWGGTQSHDTLSDCPKVTAVAQKYGCYGVYIDVQVRHVVAWIGYVPSKRPSCNPLGASAYSWMANTAGGIDYDQPCLDLEPKFTLGVDIGSFDDGSGIQLHVDPDACDILPTLGCSLLSDCVDAATRGAVKVFDDRFDAVIDEANKQIAPYLQPDNGAALGGPGICNPIVDQNCVAPLLADSLFTIAYGWFANPFTNAVHPERHYPIVGVDATNECPNGLYELRQDNYRPGVCAWCASNATTCFSLDPLSLSCGPPPPLPGLGGFDGVCPPPVMVAPSSSIRIDYAVDSDGDGIRNLDDNCPGVPNPTQTDQDQDGVGEACELCDCDADPNPDPDDDKVCTIECDGHGDNCGNTKNSGQENCNHEAELARDAEELGDACDPVPCPLFTPNITTTAHKKEVKSPFVVDVLTEQKLDSMVVYPRGSHDRYAASPTEVPTVVPATDYRFCIFSPPPPIGEGINCFDSKAVIDDTKLYDAKSQGEENSFSWWHRVTINGLGTGAPEPPRTYGEGSGWSFNWLYIADFDYWRSQDWGAWVPNVSSAMATQPAFFNSIGRFWIHAEGDLGTLDTTLGTGLHGKAADPTQPADSVANHYEQLAPFTRTLFYQNIGVPPLVVARECSWCNVDLAPDPAQCPECTLEISPELTSPISRIVSWDEGGRLGVVSTVGALNPLRASLGQHLEQSLELPLLWVDQAEPSAYLGRSRTAPVAVGVDPGSGAMVEQAFVAGGQLLGKADLQRGGPSPIDQSLVLASGPSAPPAVTGFLPVYSRSLQRVFLIGGVDATNTLVGTVRWRTLDTDIWETVPRSEYTAGKVLAATYSYADGMLWILDEVLGAKTPPHWKAPTLARLTRLDPRTGRAEVLGQWLRLKLFDQHWLRTDRDGSMLLFASSSKLHSHAIARFAVVDGELELVGFRLRARSLIHPPVVDMAGYWLITRKAKDKIDARRLDDLLLHSVGWVGQIAQCF